MESPIGCEQYDKTLLRSSYEKVHYDPVNFDLVMQVVDKIEKFVRVNWYQYISDILQKQRAVVPLL